MNVSVLRPDPPKVRAVVFGPGGRYELIVDDLTDLCRQAIERGLVVIR